MRTASATLGTTCRARFAVTTSARQAASTTLGHTLVKTTAYPYSATYDTSGHSITTRRGIARHGATAGRTDDGDIRTSGRQAGTLS